MRSTFLAWAVGALILLPAHVWAGTVRVEGGVPVRWAQPHVTYYLQQAGSDDLEPEDALAAVHKGFTSWTEVSCSELTFEELGDAPDPTVSVLAGAPANLQNEIVWIEDDHWTLGGYVLGVTAPISEGNGVIVEADIAFNGLHIQWKTGGGKGTDLESVAVHEIGHMFGQQHNLGPYPPNIELPTMHPNILPKKRSRTLEADDEIGACFLYPDGEALTCESNADCPFIMKHDSQGDEYYGGAFQCGEETGSCSELHTYPHSVSQLGEYCEHSSSCIEDLFCLQWLGQGLCTNYCVVADQECPGGFYCAAFQSWPDMGACLPESGEIAPPSGVLPGCQSGFDCAGEDLCLPSPDGESKLCTSLCTVADPVECDEDEFCHVYQEGNPTGGCFPIPVSDAELEPSPEPVPDGGPSESDAVDAEGGTEEVLTSDLGPEITETAVSEDASPESGVVDATDGSGSAVDATGCESGRHGGPAVWLLAVLLALSLSRRRRLGV